MTARCSVCSRELDHYERQRPTWLVDDAAGCEPMCDRCYRAAWWRREQDRAQGPLASAEQVMGRLQVSTAHDLR